MFFNIEARLAENGVVILSAFTTALAPKWPCSSIVIGVLWEERRWQEVVVLCVAQFIQLNPSQPFSSLLHYLHFYLVI